MTKYEQVAEILEKQGYITDNQSAKIWGDESACWKVVEHIRKWQRLQSDRQFFAKEKIVEKQKGNRKHLVRLEGQESWWKVGKEFYNEVKV